LAADIIYTYMVKDSPQGVDSIEALVRKLFNTLQTDLKVNLEPHVDTIHDLAS
jgi:hypothetical protein